MGEFTGTPDFPDVATKAFALADARDDDALELANLMLRAAKVVSDAVQEAGLVNDATQCASLILLHRALGGAIDRFREEAERAAG